MAFLAIDPKWLNFVVNCSDVSKSHVCLRKDLDVISKEVYYWSTTIDGVYHKCSFLKEKEDGRTVEGDDLQTCRVTGEVLHGDVQPSHR